jgi:hypothetical protein
MNCMTVSKVGVVFNCVTLIECGKYPAAVDQQRVHVKVSGALGTALASDNF